MYIMNKKEIMLLSCQAGFNENSTWITYIPYNIKSMYAKTSKFNGLKMFNLEKTNRFRFDTNLYDKLELGDFLCKATLEYELVDIGSLNPILKPVRLVIGSKTFEVDK